MRRRAPQGAPLDLADATITVVDSVSYTGEAVYPAVTVTYDGATLVVNTDYLLNYVDNVNIGSGTVTVTGIGEFTGSVVKTFSIVSNAPTPPGEGDWAFNVQNISDSPTFAEFVEDTSGTWQLCPSQDESRLLVGVGSGYYLRIGSISGFDPSTFVQEAATSSGVDAGHVMHTPDGIHYLLAAPSASSVQMRIASDAYDITTIPGSANSTCSAVYVYGGCISSDGCHVVFSTTSGGSYYLKSGTLTTAWDLSTLTDVKTVSVSAPHGPIFMNQYNGTQLVHLSLWNSTSQKAKITLHTLGTAWDVSTITGSVTKEFPSVTESDKNNGGMNTGEIKGVCVNMAGTKMILSAYHKGTSYYSLINLA